MANFVDCRRFDCTASTTSVFFVHVGSIDRYPGILECGWFKTITDGKPTDRVIVSCTNPDMSQ